MRRATRLLGCLVGLCVLWPAVASSQMRWALGFENGPAFTSYNIARNASFHVGYRLLEGGADVTEVYTFTLVNYLAIGATVRF